jgi:hypothetical protein
METKPTAIKIIDVIFALAGTTKFNLSVFIFKNSVVFKNSFLINV